MQKEYMSECDQFQNNWLICGPEKIDGLFARRVAAIKRMIVLVRVD